MPRKIIQIQALRFQSNCGDKETSSQDTELVALCDDGTVWTCISALNGEWVQAPEIPQDLVAGN